YLHRTRVCAAPGHGAGWRGHPDSYRTQRPLLPPLCDLVSQVLWPGRRDRTMDRDPPRGNRRGDLVSFRILGPRAEGEGVLADTIPGRLLARSDAGRGAPRPG